jgi:RDD family
LEKKEKIAIGVCIAVVVSALLEVAFKIRFIPSSSVWLSGIINFFIPPNHPGMLSKSFDSLESYRWYGLFFLIWGGIGLLVYYNTGRKSSSLLQFMLAFLIVKLCIGWFMWVVLLLINSLRGQDFWAMYHFPAEVDTVMKNRVIISLSCGILSGMFYIWLYLYAFRAFAARRVLQTEVTPDGELRQVFFVQAEKSERLLNSFADQFLVFWFLLSIVKSSLQSLNRCSYYDRDYNDAAISLLELQLLVFLLMLIYYPLTEMLFKKSLGKILTNTVVTDSAGKHPGFLTILGRTLCRFIPFDAFSFLSSGRGWHDSISGTYVLKEQSAEEETEAEFDFLKVEAEKT